eukprot:2304476-Ditylum_brightwellii.AAC.1
MAQPPPELEGQPRSPLSPTHDSLTCSYVTVQLKVLSVQVDVLTSEVIKIKQAVDLLGSSKPPAQQQPNQQQEIQEILTKFNTQNDNKMSKIMAEFMDLCQDRMSTNVEFSRTNQGTKDELLDIKDLMLRMCSAVINCAVAWADKMIEVKETDKKMPSKAAFIQDKMDKEYKDT